MKPLNFLVAAALGCMSAGAFAKDDGLEGVKDQAKATYKMDKKACEPLPRDEQKRCEHRAKAQYDQATADLRRMKAEQRKEDAAARAEKRDRKERLDVGSGGYQAHGDGIPGSSKIPAAGAQSSFDQRTAKPEPGKTMGNAPLTAGGSPDNTASGAREN